MQTSRLRIVFFADTATQSSRTFMLREKTQSKKITWFTDQHSKCAFRDLLYEKKDFAPVFLAWLPIQNGKQWTKDCVQFTVVVNKDYNLGIQKTLISWRMSKPLFVGRMNEQHATSWLSTLGGAHSSMGDFYHKHSIEAAMISVQQYQLAVKTGNQVLQGRCRIYFAHSLLQRGKLKTAAKIIRRVYKDGKTSNEDLSLVITCCHAAWSKYIYLRGLKKDKVKILFLNM